MVRRHHPASASATRRSRSCRCWPGAALVGHRPTRNRGTIGGSIANADPAAEIPLVAVTLDAAIVAPMAKLEMPARDFFLGPMVTSLPAGALRRRPLPVWREPGRRRLPRDQRAAERFRLCVRRGAARARRRRQCSASRSASAGHRPADAARQRRAASSGTTLDDSGARGTRSAAPTSSVERPACLRRLSPPGRRRPCPRALADARRARPGRKHEVELDINGKTRGRGRAAHDPARLPARRSRCSPARMPAASTAFAAPARC